MNDTPSRIATKMQEMIGRKSSAERLRFGCSMFDLSRQLVKDSILGNDPKISSADLRRQLFLRFYGKDFDLSQQRKIIQYLSENPPCNAKANDSGKKL